MKSQIGRLLLHLANAFRERFPARLVDLSLKDFAERRPEDLQRGVITFVFAQQTSFARYAEAIEVNVVGQVQLREAATGAEVQDGELDLLEQIKAFAGNPPSGLPQMQLVRASSSNQLEVPFGWVSVTLAIGPVDSSDLWLPEDCGDLSPLSGVRPLYDLDPHASLEDVAQLLDDQDVPGQPDAADAIELEQAP